MPKKTVVIGLGNTLRRDDGIGIAVLGSLLNCFKRKYVEYLDFGTASFGLIYRLEEYDKVLLIDAIDAGLMPGELRIFALDKIKIKLKNRQASAHEFNLNNLYELCRKLKLKTKIYVAGIQVKDVSYGEGLSIELEAKKEDIAREIDAFIIKTNKLR